MATIYSLVYAEAAAAVLCGLSKRRLKEVLYDLRKLAEDPFIRSDYSIVGDDGRTVEYLLAGDFVIGFFVDHAVAEIRIVDLAEV